MSELNSSPSLELEVSNFGPIVNASIDLRPLTVFVGSNNTGKSYLSKLIYALHRFFSNARGHLDGSQLKNQLSETHRSLLVPDEGIDALLILTKSVLEEGGANGQGSITLTPEICEILSSALGRDKNASLQEVVRSFGITDPVELLRRGKPSATRISLRRRISAGSASFCHELMLTRPHDYRTTIPSGVPLPLEIELDYSTRSSLCNLLDLLDQDPANGDRRQKFFAEASLLLGCQLLTQAFGAFHRPAYYLPADRTGLMHTLRVVASALIENSTSANDHAWSRTRLLSGVVGDFLEQLINIDDSLGRENSYDFAVSIEREILNGSVSIHHSIANGPPHFAFRPNGWKADLPLTNVSSTVSELVPLVLYLRYVIAPADLLIIEEPESHLHPRDQVELLRQLAELVNLGVRFIITTHSEWFLEELSNIVLRSSLHKTKGQDVQDLEASLSPEQVGVWLFNLRRRPKGAVVEEAPRGESGLFGTGYDEVAIELHNEWAEIARQAESTPH